MQRQDWWGSGDSWLWSMCGSRAGGEERLASEEGLDRGRPCQRNGACVDGGFLDLISRSEGLECIASSSRGPYSTGPARQVSLRDPRILIIRWFAGWKVSSKDRILDRMCCRLIRPACRGRCARVTERTPGQGTLPEESFHA